MNRLYLWRGSYAFAAVAAPSRKRAVELILEGPGRFSFSQPDADDFEAVRGSQVPGPARILGSYVE